MSAKISILIIYALIINPGCKKSTNKSKLKDVPTTKTAYEAILEKHDAKSGVAARNLMGVFKELKLHEIIPMVVISKSKPFIRNATPQEALGGIKEGEELFFGSPTSSHVIGMVARKKEVNKDRPEEMNVHFSLMAYDIRSYSKDQKMTPTEGISIVIKNALTKEQLRHQIINKLSQIRSFFNKPRFARDLAIARNALNTIHSIKSKSESEYLSTANELIAFGACLVILIGLMVPSSWAGARTATRLGKEVYIYMGFMLGLFLSAVILNKFIPWITKYLGKDDPSYQNMRNRLNIAKATLESFALKHGSDDAVRNESIIPE